MVTTIGTEREVVELVKDLIFLDYDAIEAYVAAIERVENVSAKEKLTAFRDDHERHTRELSALMEGGGERPPEKGDAKAVLTKGKVVMAGLQGDRAIMEAMRTNEDDTNTAYERAAERDDLDPELSRLVRQNLEDERRHCAWIKSFLENTSGG